MRCWLLVLLAAAALAPAALARSPRTGDMAVTAAAGPAASPDEDALHGRPSFALAYELYWTAGWSVRGGMGRIRLEGDEGATAEEIAFDYLAAGVCRNWLRGPVFPYVTGGVGLYRRDLRNAAGGDGDSWEPGASAGVGIEVHLAAEVTLRLEGTVHAVAGSGPNLVGVADLGVKVYF